MFGLSSNTKKVVLERVEISGGAGVTGVLEPERDTTNNAWPEPTPEASSVMERAKAVIAPFDNNSDIEWLDCEIARLSREQQSLYGLEAHAASALATRVSEMQREVRVARAFETFSGKKLRLSNEVLTWRKNPAPEALKYHIPIPEVALFGLRQNTVRITAQFPTHGEMDPAIPQKLLQLYGDVCERLGSLSAGFTRGTRGTYGLFAAFSGVIPLETKEKIRKAEKNTVFDDIRVLAEADWTLDYTPMPFYADPIVVGIVEDEMWVIDVFDPTPLEEYIAREFTT